MPLKGEHLSLEQKRHLREINLGKHHSQESKNKISIGVLRHLKQYPITEETKQRNKESHMGHPVSKETRAKLHKAFLGRIISEETRKKMSESRRGKPLSEGHKRNISIARTGVHLSDETKSNLSMSHRGRHHTEETKQRLREVNLGKHLSEQHRGKISAAHKGKVISDVTKKKLHMINKNLWKNEEYAKKMIASFKAKPNGLELYLDFILQNYFPDEWKYVGDGQEIISGLCPDFINVNGKKQIIELFGDYWHNRAGVGYTYTEDGRKYTFKEYGYDTLILWEHEMKDEDTIIQKIKEFSERA